ncbi:MAG: NUDIX domain-containing protein [Gammaproteobacteria bacterium]|nr:NUDIX domain-containing protein [Gammaproteobacteria bacterium]
MKGASDALGFSPVRLFAPAKMKGMKTIETVTIVDSRDQVAGAAPRAEMRRRGLIHRVNYILVFNAAGEILAQRRTMQKDLYPGLVDLAAGGVVLDGEDYAESAARELREELGVAPPLAAQFDMWFEDAARTPPNRSWGRVFSCVHEGPFELQESEVASAEFMTVDAALSLAAGEVTPDSRQALLAHIL